MTSTELLKHNCSDEMGIKAKHTCWSNHWYSIFQEAVALFTRAFEAIQLKEKKTGNTIFVLVMTLIEVWFFKPFGLLIISFRLTCPCCYRKGLNWYRHHEFYLNEILQKWNGEEITNFLHREFNHHIAFSKLIGIAQI